MNAYLDPEIHDLIEKETDRQKHTLALIPSENYCSQEVREAVGSVLTNKYAEGYPGRRYYNGNDVIDAVERLAIERAKKLFKTPHANVQPYSGSPANAAVYMALVSAGEPIMGMKLSAGGHLTHGHPNITFSGKYFRSVQFDVREDGWIDMDEVSALAKREKPKLFIIGPTAYPRILDWKGFGEIAHTVGAYFVADISHIAGLILAGVHPTPVPYADIITTTTHKTLRGPRGAMILVTQKGLEKDPKMAEKIDRAVFPGLQGGPHENVIAGIAVALNEASTDEFKAYGRQIGKNAKALAETLLKEGLTFITGGTDNHLMVVDLRPQKKTGKEVADSLEEVGIIVNRNSVPHDTASPFNPSGIRLGTPAVTTRGMKEKEMREIGKIIGDIINANKKNISIQASKVQDLCTRYSIR
jgi:glycine hydroxymethyltransferase